MSPDSTAKVKNAYARGERYDVSKFIDADTFSDITCNESDDLFVRIEDEVVSILVRAVPSGFQIVHEFFQFLIGRALWLRLDLFVGCKVARGATTYQLRQAHW